jgi:3-hydroxymyristoyl/3-hydroxydecanoyl-(acyl carrier protein) dehydratase
MTPDYDLAHLLPHRPPFRLVDRLRRVDLPGGRLVGERRVTCDDPLLPPGAEALPPLLLIEALCQAAACLNGLEALAAAGPAGLPALESAHREGGRRHRGYLVSAAGFEFPDQVWIGELLVLQVTREGRMGQMASFQAEARAEAPGEAPGERLGGGRLITSGRLLFAVTIA